jgi:Protein of unknown function (DUF2950)
MTIPQDRGGSTRQWLTWMCLSISMSVACASQANSSEPAQRSFPTAERAVAALVVATRSGRLASLSQVLGPAGVPLIRSGDPVADRTARERFLAAYARRHRIELEGSGKAVLVVGTENWPMPIPLVRTTSGWHFDTPAGQEEILNRRIGRDELAVIQVCRAYVHAQLDYAALRAHRGSPAQYAQHLMSRPGTRDGLYWPTRAGEPQSPFGPLVSQARAGGYVPGRRHDGPHPYYGYYFRILTAQGPHAPGGAQSYLVDGRMTRGFALVAYPAKYGVSGIMTFMVSRAGIVFQRNLGPQTETIAADLTQYDPDSAWSTP